MVKISFTPKRRAFTATSVMISASDEWVSRKYLTPDWAGMMPDTLTAEVPQSVFDRINGIRSVKRIDE